MAIKFNTKSKVQVKQNNGLKTKSIFPTTGAEKEFHQGNLWADYHNISLQILLSSKKYKRIKLNNFICKKLQGNVYDQQEANDMIYKINQCRCTGIFRSLTSGVNGCFSSRN
jgi:hypothetical protein